MQPTIFVYKMIGCISRYVLSTKGTEWRKIPRPRNVGFADDAYHTKNDIITYSRTLGGYSAE